MTRRSSQPDGQPATAPFTPVVLRARKDGWTPEKQTAFIQALAATCCVEEAARHVGMSARSARDLRTRRDAASLRAAWDAALTAGTGRIAEAAMARAVHGVVNPIFYKGEQIGERRHFDERLTTFLLRYHQPQRYGAWRDKMMVQERYADGTAMAFEDSLKRLVADCVADAIGTQRTQRSPLRLEVLAGDEEDEAAKDRLHEMYRRAAWEEFQRQIAAERVQWEKDARAEHAAQGGSSGAANEGNTASAAYQGGS